MKFISKKVTQWQDRITLGMCRFVMRISLLLLILILLIPDVILPLFARPLMRSNNPSAGAGAVIVLGGDPVMRVPSAAQAVLKGYGPKLLLIDCQSNHLEDAGLMPKESELTMLLAEKAGLRKDQISVLDLTGRATSTVDEAKSYRDYFVAHSIEPRRVVVVTSWPHSSRAAWILEKALMPLDIKVEMMPVDRVPFTFEEWWKSEEGMIFVFEEYIKWARYLYKYAGRSIPE